MNNQFSFSDIFGSQFPVVEPVKKIKQIIWHYSLTAVYTECPYCHSHNSENEKTGECKICHEIMGFDEPVIKKSKDVLECERLGLRGAVTKDEKGNWVEAN